MAGGQGLLEQHDDRQPGDPVEVHHPAEEQQRHQPPAAPETERAILDAHAEGAPPAGAPVVHQELERAATMLEAGLLERRELIQTRRHQDRPGEQHAGAVHRHRRQDAGRLEGPLQAGGEDAEAAPDRNIAPGEEAGRQQSAAAALALAPVDRGEQQDHRRRAGQHHRDHHHPPHGDHDTVVAKARSGRGRHRRHRAADGGTRLDRRGGSQRQVQRGHVPGRHPHVRARQHVGPGDQRHHAERGDDHDAIPPEDRLQCRHAIGVAGHRRRPPQSGEVCR